MKHTGIHILDFNDKIIDYISRDDGALLNAVMSTNAEEKSETFDFTMLNDRAEHLRERNRIIVQDNNGVYREFIISHVVDNFDGTTDVESNASYLEDIDKSRPIKPGKYSSYSTSQALNETLRNTGWEMSDDTEHGGMRTTSWTSYSTPYEVINMLCTTYGMVADYSIELGSHTVEHRYVTLKKPVSLFKGKEITKGKDLTGMTRTVDMSEVRTALYAIGPENDTGQRLEKIITDDDAQAQFGLPGRYLWSVYEPESDDSNMTDERLTTLAKTELNKRNKSAISYEITSTDIHKHYPEMVVSLHDTVRIKDRDFRPPLYIEAEVIGVDYDLLQDESSYKFGNVVEYEESSLRDIFNKKLADISKKLNDNVTNINTIVNDVVAGQLEYFERKIFKQDTPPDNPVNDMLWYDTSNPNVAVLRRYWNGEWLNETVDDVEKIGGITREKALLSELQNTFANLSIQHSKILNDTNQVLNSEYLVDTDLKNKLQTEINNIDEIYLSIQSDLNAMTPDTATIGALIDIQSQFSSYRQKLQDLYKAMRDAQVSADKRLQLLQSQYTDEKFNDALNNIAKTLPGGYWDPEKQQLIGDIPNKDDLAQLQDTLKQYTAGQIDSLSSAIGQQTDSKINQAKDEISASVNSVKKDIEQSTDDKLKPITTRVTDSESSIKVLQDGLKLTATKNDVQQTLNENLEPIKNQVNQQQSTLDVLPGQIASKVSQHDYETDKDNIVQRLDNSDSERLQLSNEIKDRVTLEQYNNLRVGGRNYLAMDNVEFGTFVSTTGVPTGSATTRIRNINYIPVTPSDNYIMKINAPDPNKPIQASIYQFNTNNTLVKTSGFMNLSDTLNYKFDTGVDKVKILFRHADNTDMIIDEIKNAKIKFEKGTIPTDYDADPSETDRTLTKYGTSIAQNGKDISLRATKEEFNATKQTLSRTISDFTNNVATGMTFTYDKDGAIQNMNIGQDGIKLKGDKVDITVNRDFNVVTQTLNNKVGKDEVVNRLNLSNEGLDINVNKLGIVGGDSTNNLTIRNNQVLSRGKYSRTWSGVTDTPNATVGIRNGYIMSSNEDTGYNLYMTEKGLSTMMSGGLGSEQAGALEFHYDLMNDRSRGVRLSSTYGVVFLQSEQSRIYTRSRFTTNIETWEGSIYLRPWTGGRVGANEFSFYIKQNDTPQFTDGVLLFGEISNETNIPGYGNAGSGIRFRKAGMPTETYGDYEPIVYATNNQGDIGSGSFYANRLYGDWTAKTDNLYANVKDKLRITDIKGYNNGGPNYKDLQCRDIQSNSIRLNDTDGKDFYIGVSSNELRVTNNLFWNGGNTGYKPVRASDFIKASSAEFKKEIKPWDYDVLSVLANELKLYSYKYKDDEKEVIHHGPVIGDNYETPVEFILQDGVNTNEMLSWSLRAIQQLNEKVEKLEEQINGK
ncbi:phage minor structural, N-terminal region domain protein [Staphylococcus warneri]|uniref:phage tail spike protein n=1 Tax=Staphylococcus warneri TaxID=1292 RepID=UPI000F6B6CF4|nr:phage tail spike protein [Staphylococcus warneri]VED32359.1 phage minor structural, N-terminal region domain protein [Staphylococcus warneri]